MKSFELVATTYHSVLARSRKDAMRRLADILARSGMYTEKIQSAAGASRQFFQPEGGGCHAGGNCSARHVGVCSEESPVSTNETDEAIWGPACDVVGPQLKPGESSDDGSRTERGGRGEPYPYDGTR